MNATTGVKGNTPDDFRITTQTDKVKEHQSELGMNEFLQLMVAQLQNQDPTSPQDNTEFVSQMAQYSSLEAMNNMSASFTQNQTFNLIGKGVVGVVKDLNGNASQVIGVVDSAGVENKKAYIMIGEKKVWADDVEQVFDASIVQGNTSGILAGANLVGKYVSATVNVDNETVKISGKVESMSVEDDNLYLMVKGHKVLMSALTSVADSEEDLISATTEGQV